MLSPAEKQERLAAMEDVIGTHRAEGIKVNATVHQLMMKFVDGEITLEQFSSAVDRYAETVLGAARPLAGAA